jgi:hypothetical protein
LAYSWRAAIDGDRGCNGAPCRSFLRINLGYINYVLLLKNPHTNPSSSYTRNEIRNVATDSRQKLTFVEIDLRRPSAATRSPWPSGRVSYSFVVAEPTSDWRVSSLPHLSLKSVRQISLLLVIEEWTSFFFDTGRWASYSDGRLPMGRDSYWLLLPSGRRNDERVFLLVVV